MPQDKPSAEQLRAELQAALVTLNQASTPGQRARAQARVDSIRRRMATAGVSATTPRPPAPAPRARPTAAPPRPATPAPAAKPTAASAQGAMRERREAERELGMERGRIRLRPKRP